tara:strand:+ start:270 stop:1082 length:813 start_codon:yes stop_codon:yes gene_type:complete
MLYYINGKYIKQDDAVVSFNDAGFLYGDGLFETMRFDGQKIFSFDKHFKRLYNGLNIIDLNINYSRVEILDILNTIIKKNNLQSGIIKLMITRGNLDDKDSNPGIYISIKPFYNIPDTPVKVIYLDETKYPIIRFNPAIKSMNYLGNMLAKKDTQNQGAFEPVFYNKNNIITECAIRNIFYIKNNILQTPPLNLGILGGVMRKTIIHIAHSLNIEVQEREIDLNEVSSMDEAFISSTGIGLLACYWDEWKSEYELTNNIKKELFNRIKSH